MVHHEKKTLKLQAKMTGKIPKSMTLNKIQQDHRRKFPKTKERHTHRKQETHRVPSRQYLKRIYSKHVIVKTLAIQNKVY